MRYGITLPVLMLLGLTNSDRLAVRVSPAVIMKGGAFNLFCHVPRDPDNRVVEYGVVGLRPGSQRDLAGDKAPITWGPILVEHVPCEAGPAYCAVKKNDGTWQRVEVPLHVAACEDGQ